MDIMKLLSIRIYPVAVAVIILTGIGIIITAVFASSTPLQIALGLGGVGLISLGLIVIKLVHDEKESQEKLDALLQKIDEVQQEMQKEEKKDNSGIAIADIISSGMKFYTDFKSKDKTDE